MILDDEFSANVGRDLMRLVDEALEKKGVSARQASLDVAGHTTLIRNIKSGSIPGLDRVLALFKYLDVTPRDLDKFSSLKGLAAFAEDPAPYSKGYADTEALSTSANYRPIPFHKYAIGETQTPIALSMKWVNELALPIEHLYLLRSIDDSMPRSAPRGALMLIDCSRVDVNDGPVLSAYREGITTSFGHISADSFGMVITSELDDMRPLVVKNSVGSGTQVIGVVIACLDMSQADERSDLSGGGIILSKAQHQRLARYIQARGRVVRYVANAPTEEEEPSLEQDQNAPSMDR